MAVRYKLALILASAIVGLDQLTKAIITDGMPLWASRPVIPDFFNIVHVLNRGAAFGFLNRSDIDWQRYLFLGITVLALLVIFSLLKQAQEKERILPIGLGLIAGGAIGNFIDRISTGAVVDFLDFYVGTYHWPAFNVADIAICVGAGFVALATFRSKDNASDSV
ncbi:MAG: signal peptidase II [Desulfovibrio sp.]